MKNHYSVTFGRLRALHREWSLTATAAGLVAAIVSYAGPFAVVLQATHAAGLDAGHTASWVWALAIGSGVSGIVLSLATRMPVIVAWSTPGAALLLASIGGYRFSDAVGAFLLASLAATVLGVTGWFGKIIAVVPGAITSALLAGILLPFVIAGSAAVTRAPLVAGTVVVAFVAARRFAERYAVVLALVAGAVVTALTGSATTAGLSLTVTAPILTMPTFDPQAVLSIGVPLLLITMAGQNAPGLTVLRQAGYQPDDRVLVGGVSAVSALLTPFGGHAINLAAITAAICTGSDSHPDRRRRYVAGVVCGAANLVAGVFAASLVSAYAVLPAAMIAALAAVALLPSVVGALTATISGPAQAHIPAVATLAITASGIVVHGVGSAFWALVVGGALWLSSQPRKTERTRAPLATRATPAAAGVARSAGSSP